MQSAEKEQQQCAQMQEFITLLDRHPELYSDLRQLLGLSEPLPEVQEAQQQTNL